MSVVAEATKISRTAAIAASAAVHSQDHLLNGRVDTAQRETAALVPATSIEISQTGRLLMRILAIASGTADTSNAGTIKHPLLNVAVTDPTAMASALASSLRNAVEFSGLFYESHLAQWVVDARQEECVLREPQAALSPEETSLEGERIAQLVHALVVFRPESVPALDLGIDVAGPVYIPPEKFIILLENDRPHRPGPGIVAVGKFVGLAAESFVRESGGEA